MISVEEARERILSFFQRLEPEEKPILDALGQVLAEEVRAAFDIPPLDNTAMDGYAVRAADTAGASDTTPVPLRVIGELAAGYVFDGEVAPGAAVRIMTGAPIPRGADAVVPFEETILAHQFFGFSSSLFQHLIVNIVIKAWNQPRHVMREPAQSDTWLVTPGTLPWPKLNLVR